MSARRPPLPPRIPCMWIPWVLILIFACDPLVNRFADIEKAEPYTAGRPVNPPADADTILVMTWNIRFGAGRTPWFGDGCGDRVIFSEGEIVRFLSGIAGEINRLRPDILLLQGVDVQSKRSAYIDQVQWLLDHTYLDYASYASMWEAQIVPSDGLGRINTGQAILARWPILESERIQLPLRSDQDALTRYFYLRRCMLKTRIALPGTGALYVLNIHLDAFSTDGTKKRQIDRVKEELDKLAVSGAIFIAGGDFNLIPPGSDSTDFCLEDKCPDESYHRQGDDPMHKEGSYFTPEVTWLQELYDAYSPSVPLEKYQANQELYFTSTPDWNGFWNRKIDHLFTNTAWVPASDSTHQDILDLSDHVPVSARWQLPKGGVR
jgi:endonuclease/exonuclease/phosphatase family metal-dependent hydrolase